jgi:hypothetical protein
MRKIIGAIVGGGIAVFAGTNAMDDNTTRDEAGTITEAGGLGAFVIEVGDCVQVPEETMVASVEGVPCNQPHDAQAFAEHQLLGDEYPGDSAIENDAYEGCVDRWRSSIGTVWEDDKTYDLFTLTPTQESWEQDDRAVTCFVVRIDGAKMTADLLS